MIYRTVVAVVLAGALVSAALPGIEDARRERTAAMVADDVDDLVRTARVLVENDDPIPGAGARRHVQIRLPPRSTTSAAVEAITIRPRTPGRPAAVRWVVADGRTGRRSIPDLPLATPNETPLELAGTGRHRLVLTLDGTAGDPLVTVRRFK